MSKRDTITMPLSALLRIIQSSERRQRKMIWYRDERLRLIDACEDLRHTVGYARFERNLELEEENADLRGRLTNDAAERENGAERARLTESLALLRARLCAADVDNERLRDDLTALYEAIEQLREHPHCLFDAHAAAIKALVGLLPSEKEEQRDGA